MKNNYNIGNQIVQCDFMYSLMVESSKQYLAEDNSTPDIIIDYCGSELEECNRLHSHLSIGQCECIYSLEKYALKVAQYKKLLLHASAIMLNEKAILFCGDGSVGKTTQVNLWKDFFGKDAEVLSDDRPVVGEHNGEVYVWNTPWSKYQNTSLHNDGAKVEAICFLQKNQINNIQLLNDTNAIQLWLSLYPKTICDDIKDDVNEIVLKVPSFLFQNNASLSYVKKAYETIINNN